MRYTKYTITFVNKVEYTLHAFGFVDAIILGMAWAINNGYDKRINQITDEKNITIKNIKSDFTFDR